MPLVMVNRPAQVMRMDATSAERAWGLRAARVGAVVQAAVLVVVGVVLVVVAAREPTPTCSMCWSKGTGPALVAIGCVLVAFLYAAAGAGLRAEPRGQWVALAVTEAAAPIAVFGAHLEGHYWSFSTRWLLGWVPNLAILALLMTRSALRAAWARPQA